MRAILDQGYTTPEGYWLPRPIYMPDARSFDDVLIYHGEYPGEHQKNERPEPFAYLSGKDWRTGRPSRTPIGPYCNINATQIGGARFRSIMVEPTQAALDIIAAHGVTVGDPNETFSFRVLVHSRESRNEESRALIIAEPSLILGGIWLAYVDPTTIPAA